MRVKTVSLAAFGSLKSFLLPPFVFGDLFVKLEITFLSLQTE